jgi:hypothetical protein
VHYSVQLTFNFTQWSLQQILQAVAVLLWLSCQAILFDCYSVKLRSSVVDWIREQFSAHIQSRCADHV